MSRLRTLKKLVLGETWSLPLGVAAVTIVAALVVRPLSGDRWDAAGGFILLLGIVGVLLGSVARSARGR
jgi:hypothetical protein